MHRACVRQCTNLYVGVLGHQQSTSGRRAETPRIYCTCGSAPPSPSSSETLHLTAAGGATAVVATGFLCFFLLRQLILVVIINTPPPLPPPFAFQEEWAAGDLRLLSLAEKLPTPTLTMIRRGTWVLLDAFFDRVLAPGQRCEYVSRGDCRRKSTVVPMRSATLSCRFWSIFRFHGLFAAVNRPKRGGKNSGIPCFVCRKLI